MSMKQKGGKKESKGGRIDDQCAWETWKPLTDEEIAENKQRITEILEILTERAKMPEPPLRRRHGRQKSRDEMLAEAKAAGLL